MNGRMRVSGRRALCTFELAGTTLRCSQVVSKWSGGSHHPVPNAPTSSGVVFTGQGGAGLNLRGVLAWMLHP